MVSFNSRYSFTSKIFEVDLVKYKAVNGEYFATFIDGLLDSLIAGNGWRTFHIGLI